jgi:hypothetical protein
MMTHSDRTGFGVINYRFGAECGVNRGVNATAVRGFGAVCAFEGSSLAPHDTPERSPDLVRWCRTIRSGNRLRARTGTVGRLQPAPRVASRATLPYRVDPCTTANALPLLVGNARFPRFWTLVVSTRPGSWASIACVSDSMSRRRVVRFQRPGVIRAITGGADDTGFFLQSNGSKFTTPPPVVECFVRARDGRGNGSIQ